MIKQVLSSISSSSEIIECEQNSLLASSNKFHLIRRHEHERPYDITKDGFEYNKTTSTTQKYARLSEIWTEDKNVIVKSHTCYGRLQCINDSCDFKLRATELNFTANHPNAKKTCYFCTEQLLAKPCKASRHIIYSNFSNIVVVHYGKEIHTCGRPTNVLSESTKTRLVNLFNQNINLTHKQAFRIEMINHLDRGASTEELFALTDSFIDHHTVNNIKAKVKKTLMPEGLGIEAALAFKNKMEADHPSIGIIIEIWLDSFLCVKCLKVNFSSQINEKIETVCENCKVEMQPIGPVLLITSKLQLKTAWLMSEGNNTFRRTSCHVDHQPSRCVDYNTFNVVIYDHTICSMAHLFTAHTLHEDQYSVYTSYEIFNRIYMRENKTESKFSPFGHMSDLGGGIGGGIVLFFGEDAIHGTDEFHYKQCVYAHASSSLGTVKDRKKFLTLCYMLLEAATIPEYDSVHSQFITWIEEDTTGARAESIGGWLKFWHGCRPKWCRALTCPSLPPTSLAESIQSGYSKKSQSKNLSVMQSLKFGFGECLTYMRRVVGSGSDEYRGKGPSLRELNMRQASREMETVRKSNFSTKELNKLFERLGFNIKKTTTNNSRTEDDSINKKFNLLINAENRAQRSIGRHRVDPKSPSGFRRSESSKLRIKINYTKRKKTGRPKGTKRNRNKGIHPLTVDEEEEEEEDDVATSDEVNNL